MSPTATRYISERLSLFIKIIGGRIHPKAERVRLFWIFLKWDAVHEWIPARSTSDRVTGEDPDILGNGVSWLTSTGTAAAPWVNWHITGHVCLAGSKLLKSTETIAATVYSIAMPQTWNVTVPFDSYDTALQKLRPITPACSSRYSKTVQWVAIITSCSQITYRSNFLLLFQS